MVSLKHTLIFGCALLGLSACSSGVSSGDPMHDVVFDHQGWTEVRRTDKQVVFKKDQDELSCISFQTTPEIPCTLDEVPRVREFYRGSIMRVNGALICADVALTNNLKYIKIITKRRSFPRRPPKVKSNEPLKPAIIYEGTLVFPFKGSSYVITVACPDSEETGRREAVMLTKLIEQGRVRMATSDGHAMEGWQQDPYDNKISSDFMMNRGEQEEYDKDFPNSPLSRVRKVLNTIIATADFGGSFHGRPHFEGPKQ